MKNPPREISLAELLQAREQRQQYREQLLERFDKPVICLMVNQPGAQKVTDAAVLVFREGQRQMRKLKGIGLHEEERRLDTGWEGFWVVDAEGLTLKQQLVEWEEKHPLGRLWDFDVWDPLQGPLSREEIGWPARRCLLCSASGVACARSKRHTLEELDKEIQRITEEWLQRKDDEDAGIESVGNGKCC